MNRNDFCKAYWSYYLILEKDFLDTERYVTFDIENASCYSTEFVKQYQAICSEIDVILKSICEEVNSGSTANKMDQYSTEILSHWPNIGEQKVRMRDIELQPLAEWTSATVYHPLVWWSNYNHVKHERLLYYKQANLRNVLNALAALYIFEQYFVKLIGERDGERDVPDDVSKLFEMMDYTTKHTVVGKDAYLVTTEDVTGIFTSAF